jgi:hypothetical protein
MTERRVYKVKMYNPATDQALISRRMATEEGAAIMRGEIIEDSAFVVDLTELKGGMDPA